MTMFKSLFVTITYLFSGDFILTSHGERQNYFTDYKYKR